MQQLISALHKPRLSSLVCESDRLEQSMEGRLDLIGESDPQEVHLKSITDSIDIPLSVTAGSNRQARILLMN
jgi:hypothetical protein